MGELNQVLPDLVQGCSRHKLRKPYIGRKNAEKGVSFQISTKSKQMLVVGLPSCPSSPVVQELTTPFDTSAVLSPQDLERWGTQWRWTVKSKRALPE